MLFLAIRGKFFGIQNKTAYKTHISHLVTGPVVVHKTPHGHSDALSSQLSRPAVRYAFSYKLLLYF